MWNIDSFLAVSKGVNFLKCLGPKCSLWIEIGDGLTSVSRIFNSLSHLVWVALMLASLGVAGLWVRSYSHCDVLWRQRGPGDRLGITSEFGLITVEWEGRQTINPQAGWVYFDKPLPRRWHRPRGPLGFSVYHESVRHYLLAPRTPLWGVTLPHLFLVILLAMPAIAWLVRRRREIVRQIRGRGGLCRQCGYDLRGSTSGICPECGTPSATARLL